MFHEPCRGNFSLGIECRVTRNLQAFRRRPPGQLVVLFSREDGILEEGTGAAAILVPGCDQHCLAGSKTPHRFARVRQGWSFAPAREVLLQVGVLNARGSPGGQRVSDAKNDEVSSLGGVEDAGAIAEPTSLTAQFAHLAILEVERLHRLDCLCDLLSVGAHLLHWSTTNAARNAAEALDASAIAGHGTSHKFVPVLA